jgi:hypothetical protein
MWKLELRPHSFFSVNTVFPIFGTLYFAVQMELLMGKLRPIIIRVQDKLLFKRDGGVDSRTSISSNLNIIISVHALLHISSCYKQAGCMKDRSQTSHMLNMYTMYSTY